MTVSVLFLFVLLSIVTERALTFSRSTGLPRMVGGLDHLYSRGGFAVGFLLSLGLHLDVFGWMLDPYDPVSHIGWHGGLTGWSYLSLLIGSVLSACLLSWGAQLAHYLLIFFKNAPPQAQAKGIHYQPAGLDIAKIAIGQNQENLYKKHPNIYKLLPAFFVSDGVREPCVDICLLDNDKHRMPHHLPIQYPDGGRGSVRTRVIANFKRVKPHTGVGSLVANSKTTTFFGTLGCVLSSARDKFLYALTCNHVLTGGFFESPGAIGDLTAELVFGTATNIGTWEAGLMNENVDAALIKLDSDVIPEPNELSKEIFKVTDHDSGVTKVALTGALSGPVTGFIIHIDQPFDVDYKNKSQLMSNLITLSSDTNASNFTTLTQEGDSGSIVFHAGNKQVIGVVVGGNDQFTFVIPMQQVLSAFPTFALSIFK